MHRTGVYINSPHVHTPPGSISVIGKWCGSFYTYHFYCQVSLTTTVPSCCWLPLYSSALFYTVTTIMQPFKLMKRVVVILLRRRSSLPVFYLPIHTWEKRDKTEVEKKTSKAVCLYLQTAIERIYITIQERGGESLTNRVSPSGQAKSGAARQLPHAFTRQLWDYNRHLIEWVLGPPLLRFTSFLPFFSKRAIL